VTGHPFLVVSDGFPAGLLPRPTAPDFALGHAIDPARRKRARTHRWLPADRVGEPVPRWMAELTASDTAKPLVLTQNTINRYTGNDRHRSVRPAAGGAQLLRRISTTGFLRSVRPGTGIGGGAP
jgi:hypothetical protein